MDSRSMMCHGTADAPLAVTPEGRSSSRHRPPPIGSGDALLLDFDGTLIELAECPDRVLCPPDLPDLLRAVQSQLGGAVAIITGRRLACVDALLNPLILAGAGIYGAEMRLHPDGHVDAPEVPEIADLVTRLHDRFANDPRIVIEDKRSAVAIHFRLAPARAAECRQALADLAGRPPLKIIEGKCVVEACAAAFDKGSALLRLMAAEPFRGRRPVFAGDDRSDELAFAAAANLRGHGIKVGEGRTEARYRLQSVRHVRSWLRGGLRTSGALLP